MTLPRLECCLPLASHPGSSTIVHGFGCEHLEGTPLTSEEYALWKAQFSHPAGKNLPPTPRAEGRAYSGKPKRHATGYRWFTDEKAID